MLALMSPLIATAAMTAPSIVRTTPCTSFASTAARLPSRAVAAPRMILDDIFTNVAGTAAVDSVLQDLTIADSLLRSMPITGWTLLACMLTLGIGQTFEYTIHNIRHAVSSSLLPVVEAILGERGHVTCFARLTQRLLAANCRCPGYSTFWIRADAKAETCL